MATGRDSGSGAIEHPLLTCARGIAGLLDQAADSDPIYLSIPDKARVLELLAADVERAKGLLLRVLATAGDVAEETGARSAAAWLGQATHATSAASAAEGRLAEALESRYRHLQAGLLAGDVSVEQARVIVRALDALPTDLDPGVLEKAELHLLEQAAHFDAHQLRVLGRRVLEVVGPEVADAEEQRRLEAEERLARQTTRLTMRSRGDGTTDVAIRIADAAASRLRTYLEAYASPRRESVDPTGEHTDPATGERLPYPVLMGHAFCSLLEAIPAERLPQHGGSPTTVVVMIDEKTLIEKVGAAELTTGDKITATEALRLACTAHLMPMVLNGRGHPLHLGRSNRFYNAPQRIALGVRDRHCRAEGCTIPATWCEAHHLDPWSQGGRTDLTRGVLFCPWHHHRAHDPDYETEELPGWRFRFRRR